MNIPTGYLPRVLCPHRTRSPEGSKEATMLALDGRSLEVGVFVDVPLVFVSMASALCLQEEGNFLSTSVKQISCFWRKTLALDLLVCPGDMW
jgi:hypothetical protein